MHHHVPMYILRTLKGEPVDFIVQSAHDYGKQFVGWGMIIFAFFFSWIFLFPLFFSFPFIELIFTGHTTITTNGNPQTFLFDEPWKPFLLFISPALILVVSIVPSVIAIAKGIILIRKKGAWFVGTNKYLIEYVDEHVYYYLWSEFESTIATKHHKDSTLDIILTHKKLSENSVFQQGSVEHNHLGDLHIRINGKKVDLNQLVSHRGFFRNKIGIMNIHNGKFVLEMIRNNMQG